MRLRHHVGQLQAVALLVRLPPLNRSRTKTGNGTFNEPETRSRLTRIGTGCSCRCLGDERAARTDRDVGPEELIVPEKRAHVLHAALLLHAVTDVGLEPGAKLNTQHKQTQVRDTTNINMRENIFTPASV